MLRFAVLLGFFILALFATPTVRSAEALVRVELVPQGGSSFVLQGSGLEGIAVLDCELTYDPTAMITPIAIRGGLIPSDAIFNFNPSVAGQIRLFIRMAARSFNGSGNIATFNFSSIGSTTGEIRTLTANLVSVKATPVAAVVQILHQVTPEVAAISAPVPKSEPLLQTGSPGTVAQSRSPNSAVPVPSTVAHATVLIPGTISAVGDRSGPQAGGAEKPEAALQIEITPESYPTPAQPSVQDDKGRTGGSLAEVLSPLHVAEYQSVRERIRHHTGSRTPEALVELFRPLAGQIISQDPLVVESDGETTVVLRIVLPSQRGDSPVFSLFHASMVTMDQDSDGNWLLVVLPQRDTPEARLTVTYSGGRLVYPLTLVPSTDRSGDVRSDGRDEYISAAHLLLKRRKVAPSPTTNVDLPRGTEL